MIPILLIWEEIPEETRLYHFTDLTPEEHDKILLCQGQFVNSNVCNEQAEWLNEWLMDRKHNIVPIDFPFQTEGKVVIVWSGFLL